MSQKDLETKFVEGVFSLISMGIIMYFKSNPSIGLMYLRFATVLLWFLMSVIASNTIFKKHRHREVLSVLLSAVFSVLAYTWATGSLGDLFWDILAGMITVVEMLLAVGFVLFIILQLRER